MNYWNDVPKKEGRKASLYLLNTCSVPGTFFFVLLRFYPPTVQKGIVTHNLHMKNQHSECEWFSGNNYKFYLACPKLYNPK